MKEFLIFCLLVSAAVVLIFLVYLLFYVMFHQNKLKPVMYPALYPMFYSDSFVIIVIFIGILTCVLIHGMNYLALVK